MVLDFNPNFFFKGKFLRKLTETGLWLILPDQMEELTLRQARTEAERKVIEAKGKANAERARRLIEAETDRELLQRQKNNTDHKVEEIKKDTLELMITSNFGPSNIRYEYLNKFALEQLVKERNLLSVIAQAEALTPEDQISEEPLNADWFTKFRNCAQDVSDEDMQKIWARILSEEVKQTDSVSVRAMEMLSSMSKSELKLIEKAATLELDGGINKVAMSVYGGEDSPLGGQGLSLKEIYALNEINILNNTVPTTSSSCLQYKMTFTNTAPTPKIPEIGHYSIKYLKMSSSSSLTIVFMCPYQKENFRHNEHIPVTTVGKQLMRIANVKTNPEFVKHFAKTLKPEGLIDYFLIEKSEDKGYITNKTMLNEMLKNNIDFDRYRVDPSEGDDTPS